MALGDQELRFLEQQGLRITQRNIAIPRQQIIGQLLTVLDGLLEPVAVLLLVMLACFQGHHFRLLQGLVFLGRLRLGLVLLTARAPAAATTAAPLSEFGAAAPVAD